MIKKFVVAGIVACATVFAGGCNTMHMSPVNGDLSAKAGPTDYKTLKGAYAGKFLIGTACDPATYTEAEQTNIKTQYNVITPENCMKPGPIHPSENTYNWTRPDTLVKWCEDNNIKVFGHNLCWYQQTENWFFQGVNGQQPTRELVMERLHQHISTVVGRYKGRIIGWDVVNEAINDGGGAGEGLRNANWLRLIGPDYLTMAFKWAHEADPNAQLYYNDYNIESGGKHTSSMALLRRLKRDGAPIHGVGIQGHWSLGTNIAQVETAIKDYESLGLKISISELDVTVMGTNSGAFPGGGGGGAAAGNGAFDRQARVYAQLFEVFNRHASSIERVTFWGINDRRSWRANQNPLIFDAQMNPKPAFQAILDVAIGKKVPPLG